MANESSGLTFVLDQNLSHRTLELLRLARMAPVGRITSPTEMGFAPEALDEAWMPALGAKGKHVVVTRDGEILRASVRLDAWRASGLTLLLMDGKWGQLPISDMTRSLLFWWPHMVDQAEAAAAGTAWSVPHQVPVPQKGIRLVTPRIGGGRAKAANVVEIKLPREPRRTAAGEAS